MPSVLHNNKWRPQLDLLLLPRALVPAAPERVSQLAPPLAYRLAVKLMCRRSEKLAKSFIKTKDMRLSLACRRGNPLKLKPRSRYYIEERATGKKDLLWGRNVDPKRHEPLKQLIERSGPGKRQWIHATLGDCERAMERRERVERDTKVLWIRLKQALAGKSDA